MIKTLSPYSTSTERAAEIMSKYRPIAPKPELPANSMTEDMAMSPRIRQSPYLRNLWPQLQARPTRTRKRGRGNLPVSPLSLKKQRVLGLNFSPVKNLCLQGFVHQGTPSHAQLFVPSLSAQNVGGGLDNPVASISANLVTLPLLPCQPSSTPVVSAAMPENNPKTPEDKRASWDIDLNTVAEIPEEKDLSLQLQGPSTCTVIKPQAIKPVGSSITVGGITRRNHSVRVFQKAEEVEEAIELDNFPAVITDSNNKVRMANSAYREMVGEPECSWLKSLVSRDKSSVSCTCKRICGVISLHLSCAKVPFWSTGYSCWVNIEWEKDGIKRSVHAPCDVTRVACKSKDYIFIWRFHAQPQSEKPTKSSFSV